MSLAFWAAYFRAVGIENNILALLGPILSRAPLFTKASKVPFDMKLVPTLYTKSKKSVNGPFCSLSSTI